MKHFAGSAKKITFIILNSIDMTQYPALFVGHGSPMNALEENEYSLEWRTISSGLPKPRSIVCISAHWTTGDTFITAMDEPRTIHDFSGFTEELSQVQYPAPGDPVLAEAICKQAQYRIKPDYRWGLDHGCWSVLKHMYPDADIPLIQLSLNNNLTAREHFELGQQLQYLRSQNILVIGSGNIVHNLSVVKWADEAYPWALDFDELVKKKIADRDFDSLINFGGLHPDFRLAIPTIEHYLPMLYILGMSSPDSDINFFCEDVTMGAISMTGMLVEN